MIETSAFRPLFETGRLLMTHGAREALDTAYGDRAFLYAQEFLSRHQKGDYGDLDEYDQAANRDALTTGARLLSAYQLADDTRLWIITEAENDEGRRESTMLLLPEEY